MKVSLRASNGTERYLHAPGFRGSNVFTGDQKRVRPYAVSAEAVLRELNVRPGQGLDTDAAVEVLRREGPNSLAVTGNKSAWKILRRQFSSIVIWLLIAAAIASAVTDSFLEALAISIVLVLNALTGFMIEWEADRSLQALRKATRVTARVRRDGRVQTIDSSLIVRGEIVVLSAGDRVPADARVVEAADLGTNESTLTGESLTVEKSVDKVDDSAPIAEQNSMVFLGTNVVKGRGVAVVTATGGRTELGKIGRMLRSAPEHSTPLEHRLADLGRRLVYFVLTIGGVVLLLGLLRGEPVWLMIEVSISLAVAAVPEGLPAVTTLILALGLLRMARRSAIVRHLASVETLGSTTVICTDKTGTLTENRLSVQEIFLSNGTALRVPDRADGPLKVESLLRRLLRVGVMCNEAAFHIIDHGSAADPTEAALIEAADRFRSDISAEKEGCEVVKEIPFSATEKRMIVAFRTAEGRSVAMQKGAPSVVLRACDSFIAPDGGLTAMQEDDRRRFLKTNEEMAERALRVLAFADKMLKTGADDLEGGYTFLGFMAMADRLRPGASDAIQKAKTAGIRVMMLTGDQMLTAQAIARQLGLSDDHDLVTLHSRDLAESGDGNYTELVRRAHVFARVTPEDKLKIVEALQNDGEVVAVTGDGVNDAPALRQADIGIAFGERGTDVAKEASDVVLTNDDFSTILNAIEGGRTIYANIIKFVHLMFSHNLGEILVIFGAMLAGLPLPLFPLQILWINLVTDVFPALGLALEPASPEMMRRKPRPPSQPLLSSRFLVLIAWQGAMLAAISLAAFLWALGCYGEGDHARTIALFALVAVQLGHLFNCRSRTRSAFDRFFSNPFIFAAVAVVALLQSMAMFFRPLSDVLRVEWLSLMDLGVIGLAFVLPIAIVELTKLPSTAKRRDTLNRKPSDRSRASSHRTERKRNF